MPAIVRARQAWPMLPPERKRAILDTESGKFVPTFICVGDTDDLSYDAALNRLYISGGEGFLSVFRQQDPDHYEPLAKIPTAPGARTSLFVLDLRRLYLAAPHRGAQAAEVRVLRNASVNWRCREYA